MVKVGLVAVDGMKLGCPPALTANRGRKHIDARSRRPRTPVQCGRQRRRAACATARLRCATTRRWRFVVAKPE